MPDFYQPGEITTLHDLGCSTQEDLENVLREATQNYKIGLVLPVTAGDMRAEPFEEIVQQLTEADYIDTISVTLGVADKVEDYQETLRKVAPLGDKVSVLWTDGKRVQDIYGQLNEAGLNLKAPGKGRSAWTSFGYLLGDPNIDAFVLHDCDIVDYDRMLLARLCLPMAHPSLDFAFCKAYYARARGKLYGRVVRLLVAPLIKALIMLNGHDEFLTYMQSFRYPLSGEFAVSATLARSNRIPSDWGLEVGTLAEVFRNTSTKRVCQVDLARLYEHKHQNLSLEDKTKGLMKMAHDICNSIFGTLASRGVVQDQGYFATLRAAYIRCAQDAIRQYHADAMINNLEFDRHEEEQALEGFSAQVTAAGEAFLQNPAGTEAIPNWTRVLSAFPKLPRQLRDAVRDDASDFGG